MEHLDSRCAAGDPVGGGSNQGSDWIDQDITVRDHVRPNLGLGSGGGANAQSGQGSYRKRVDIDEARRRGSGNQDDEDDVPMRNGSATRETPWKGLVNNDINHVWNHGPKFEGGFHCLYCNLRKKGGGATRFKEHLGHVGSEVIVCPNVPRNVKALMKNALYETRKKKREKATNRLRLEREIMDGLYQREGVINIEDDDDEQLQMSLRESLRDKNVARAVERRRGSGSGVRVNGLGKPRRSRSQPFTIDKLEARGFCSMKTKGWQNRKSKVKVPIKFKSFDARRVEEQKVRIEFPVCTFGLACEL